MIDLSDDVFLLVDEEPKSGAWNMAADELLLEESIATGKTFVRIYRWEQATLSLGHFQKWNLEDVPPPLRSLPVVRRLSGGGAIIHDQEITYSCVIPAVHHFAFDPSKLYDAVHGVIQDQLGQDGMAVTSRGQMESDKEGNFLCYARGDQRDLMVGGEKVVGSAQRRRKGAVLQHGSILLRRGSIGEFQGLLDFYPITFHEDIEYFRKLGMKISDVVGKNTHCIPWSAAMMERIREIQQRYTLQ